jgi:hypothetical protein
LLPQMLLSSEEGSSEGGEGECASSSLTSTCR